MVHLCGKRYAQRAGEVKAPMEFLEGVYSIKDTIEELAKNEEAYKIAAKAFQLIMNMEMKPGEGMWDAIKMFSLEKVGEMGGGLVPEGFIESENAQLIKIKKC